MMWKGGDGRAQLMTGFIKLMSCSYWLCPDTNTAAGKHTHTHTETPKQRDNDRDADKEVLRVSTCSFIHTASF